MANYGTQLKSGWAYNPKLTGIWAFNLTREAVHKNWWLGSTPSLRWWDGEKWVTTVQSVGVVAPMVSSGGEAPVISLPEATPATAGAMSAADKERLNFIGKGLTLKRTGNAAVSDSVAYTIVWQDFLENPSSLNWWNSGGDGTQIIIPVTGWYAVVINVGFTCATTTSMAYISLMRNGGEHSILAMEYPYHGWGKAGVLSGNVYCTAGQYLQARFSVWGGAGTIVAGSNQTYFSVVAL